MAAYVGPDIVETGLVLVLDAGNRKSYPGSGTSWTDLSGNSNNGTLTNGPTFTNTNGGCIVFDGTDDYSTFGNVSLLNFGTGSFSLSFWIFPTAWADGTSRGVLDKKTNDSTNGWTIYNDGGGGRANKINARLGLANNFPSVTNITINTWQHWTFVRNVSNIFWYFNASLDASSTNSTNLTDTAVFDIGRSKTWGGDFRNLINRLLLRPRRQSHRQSL